MKKVYTILYLLLLFAGCSNKHSGEKNRYAVPQPNPLVIDHPAAVIFNSDYTEIYPGIEKEKSSVVKILTPFHIPVIASKTWNIEFVKNNGDRVRLDTKTLPSRYDVILFNAVNDPVPCYLGDLRKAARDCFTQKSQIMVKNGKHNEVDRNNALLSPDTGTNVPLVNLFHANAKRGRILRMPVPDTSFIPVSLRNIPGIRWVENRVDTRTFLNVTFENDLITYSNTDRYFTNGITLSLQAPWLGRSRLSQLMLPYRHTSNISFALELVQNMYTPKDTRVAPTFVNDRPYASYLYFGYAKITSNALRSIKLTNELDMGYLGPYSLGAYLQTMVHKTIPTNDKPLGWNTQIKTDIILNYNLKVEKALIQNNDFMLLAVASAKAGTLYSNAGLGFRLQAGRQEPYFGTTSTSKTSPWQYYFFAESFAGYIAYDATLQGGIFNRDNIFTLKSSEISRWVGNAEGGIEVRYKGTGIELAQHYLSPEFKGCLWHKWGRISLIFNL